MIDLALATIESAKRRLREALLNLDAAAKQFEQTPHDPAAIAWQDSACREAEDALAIGQELGL